ncbi:hypothetical protein EVAR_86179_1 [Eumeta japonica]|uniref:Uncharacterized protein n=1 Tax=Eumeta variegata TaxID=151549 RepID=A0A4C1UD12_EUMVA|nr:hypothetical protein EVAR_86179_1 [Eumeta japonica]
MKLIYRQTLQIYILAGIDDEDYDSSETALGPKAAPAGRPHCAEAGVTTEWRAGRGRLSRTKSASERDVASPLARRFLRLHRKWLKGSGRRRRGMASGRSGVISTKLCPRWSVPGGNEIK